MTAHDTPEQAPTVPSRVGEYWTVDDYTTLEAAADLLDDIDDDTGPVRYSILERTVGEGTVGASHHTTLTAPEPDEPHDP